MLGFLNWLLLGVIQRWMPTVWDLFAEWWTR